MENLSPSAASVADPLDDLINEFNATEKLYGTLSDEEYDARILLLFKRIRNDTPAPTTARGAANAIRHALEDIEVDADAQNAQPVLKAVIRFLEQSSDLVEARGSEAVS